MSAPGLRLVTDGASLRFNLGAGDDKLIVDDDVGAIITAHGGSGDDFTAGGKGNDRFEPIDARACGTFSRWKDQAPSRRLLTF
jgi:hypothetical protein